MSLLDSIFGQFGGFVDVVNMVVKLGIDEGLVEKVIVVFGQVYGELGDMIVGVVVKIGFDSGMFGWIVEQIGGEGLFVEFVCMFKDYL